jgi:hypothetical protein
VQAPPSGPAARRGPLTITRVGIEPKTVDLSTRRAATIRYHLSAPAEVQVDLVDEEGRVARTLDVGFQEAGSQAMSWDGATDAGTPAPRGVYRYILRAVAPNRQSSLDNRQSVIYDPSRDTGGEELTPWDFTYERDTSTFRWVMPKAGFARLRIGIQGFPHLRTLLDWQPLEAGEQTITWDGLDASGLITLKAHPDLSIKLQAYALPWNTLLVRGDPHSSLVTQSSIDNPQSSIPSYPLLFRSDAAYLHARHARAVCREPRLHVEFPGAGRLDPEGRPLLSGVVPLRVTLEPRDAESVINSHFEVALFEDTTFLAEEEAGTNPFTYLWDTTKLSAGEHLLTVNILTYDDHYGVATVPVTIAQDPSP